MGYILRDEKTNNWITLIESVANRAQYSFSWGISLPDFPVRAFSWFENDLFLIAVRRYSFSVHPVGLDIRIFHKYSKKGINSTIAKGIKTDELKTLISCLGNPKKLSLCIGFDWASEFIEESLKEQVAA